MDHNPPIAYSPDDIPALTGGVVSRTRVYMDMRSGKLRAKKLGKRTLIPAEEARRYIADLPDRPISTAA